jgi:hypothetical protein
MKSNAFKSEPINDRFQMEEVQDIQRREQRPRYREERPREQRPREERPRDARWNETRNTFAGERKEKKKELKMDDENFPSLVLNENIENKVDTMNFATAAKKERIIEDNLSTMEKVPPGWIRISSDINRKIVYEYGDRTIIDDDEYDEFYRQDIINDEIGMMIRRWKKYKESYLELYGEEEYDKYFTPHDAYNTEYEDEEEYD